MLERNGATMARNAEAVGLQEAAWHLMKRRRVVRLFSVPGRRPAAVLKGWRPQGTARTAELQAADRRPNQFIAPDRAIMSCVTQVCVAKGHCAINARLEEAGSQSKRHRRYRGVAKLPGLLGIGGRSCKRPSRRGPRMGCCNYRTTSVLSCAIAHCATGAKMSSGPKNPATHFRLKKTSTVSRPLSAQTRSRL